MPTILELFKNKELLFPGGTSAKGAVKKDTETFIEQETSGIRIKSLVELNNPLIYGNEATRIVNKSTPVLEDMKSGTGGTEGDGGLIGKGIGKLTGGKLNSIGDVRDKVNSKLGIPSNQIPSRILGQIQGQTSDVPVTLGDEGNGTEFGKFLKSTGGGNPSTLLKQGVGKGIGLAKDKLRGALFGKPPGIGENEIEPVVNVTNNEVTYSIYKNSPEGGDKYSENPDLTKSKLQIPSVPAAADLKDKGKTILTSGMGKLKGKASLSKLGEPETASQTDDVEPQVLEFSPEAPYSDYKKDPERGDIYSKEPLNALENNTKLGINLNTVSPLYGINRKENERPNNQQFIENSRYSPLNPKTMKKDSPMSSIYKLSNTDGINNVSPADDYTMEENAFMKVGEEVYKDFIPLWFKKIGADKPLVFRATISGLTETSTPSWSSNKFVGNPYSFHMYDGIERSLAFNIKLAAASPIELNVIWERLKILTSYTYPTIGGGLVTPPIITFRLGDMYVDREVLLDSLSYTIPDESNWETDGKIGYLPKIIDVALSMKFIESVGAEDRLYDMEISKAAVKGINEKREADKKAIDLEAKNRGDKPAEETPPKVTAKKQSTVTVLTGDAKSAASSKIKSARDKANNLKSTPADMASGIPDPVAGQSATADNLDGKTPIVAAKEAQNTENLTEWQSDRLIRLKATGNYTNVKITSVSKLPTWVKEHSHNPENFKNPRYKDVKCVYIQAEGSFEEHGYENNTFYMAMGAFTSGKGQFLRTFANDLDDNPDHFFSPAQMSQMKKNAAESSAMDKAMGLGGMF
jgi:hypothetical protein